MARHRCRSAHDESTINNAEINGPRAVGKMLARDDLNKHALGVRQEPIAAPFVGRQLREAAMRFRMAATLPALALASALGPITASAQSSYVHHNFCLLTGSARECAYQTMDQCLAAKRGNADFCEPNGAPLVHAPARRGYP
jgi:hypothetical protein